MTRVLIVDDEPDMLLLLRLALEAEGYTTALAADGETALERVRSEPFDVMLLDVMMPVMDGWGVLQNLDESASDPPVVIVVSAKTSARDVARAYQLGAAEYVTKPFTVAELPRLITKVVGWTKAERDAHRTAMINRLGNTL